jgi:16S rRNA (guanine(527)-N(7))-methyltransferase RsmG
MPDPRSVEFISSLKDFAAQNDIALPDKAIDQLLLYYRLLNSWNSRLHLVAPCSPSEFASRHVVESLFALPHLPENAVAADVGSGAGLPIIPCLIVRPDLNAQLIESSPKKAVFLREALRNLGIAGVNRVTNARFETTPTPPGVGYVTCRGLNRFAEMFPKLETWSPRSSTLLLFGGPALRAVIEKSRRWFDSLLIPGSERRFLFVVPKHPETPGRQPS